MAREEDTCWRCGAQWTSEAAGALQPRIAVAVADNARATTEASLDTDRWINEGGSFNREPAARLRALHR